ncbi:hypothetical protein KM043_001417 [Ampulex compressa]|nr:hypothetical protein KM043_001417 [Ampulex compressa]
MERPRRNKVIPLDIELVERPEGPAKGPRGSPKKYPGAKLPNREVYPLARLRRRPTRRKAADDAKSRAMAAEGSRCKSEEERPKAIRGASKAIFDGAP